MVEQRHWLTPEDFTETIGLCQVLPGPNIGNASIVLGKIAPDGLLVAPGGTSAINVDLSQVDHSDYQALVAGDPVVVMGTVSPARDRVIATDVSRLPS